jgi:hypothetical protein
MEEETYENFTRSELIAEISRLKAERDKPEIKNFTIAVLLEAAHQRDRWSIDYDAGKAPEDWFWLIGYLTGKALHSAKSDEIEKALHHTISTAAALSNWHITLSGIDTSMRPGIAPPSEVQNLD